VWGGIAEVYRRFGRAFAMLTAARLIKDSYKQWQSERGGSGKRILVAGSMERACRKSDTR